MTINEIVNLSKEIKMTIDEERVKRQLTFVEKEHKYSIYDPINEISITDMPSVSSLLKTWYKPFDAFGKSIQMMDGNVELAEDLRNTWYAKGEKASSIGNYAHYKLEQYIWNLFDTEKDTRKPRYNLTSEELMQAQQMVQNGVNLIHKIIENRFVPIDTECIMGSYNLGYFGQCDNIWLGEYKNQIVFLMTDYKTNKTKNFEAKPYHQPMNEPFENLIDTELSKYYLQQPLYAQLLKDMLKDTPYREIPFLGFRILHLRDGGTSFRIPKWVYKEIQKIYPVNDDTE